jgi:hypothetical protein
MKKVFVLFAVVTMFLSACNSKAKDAQGDPKAVAEAIFDAAKSGKYDGLAALIDSDADKDSKMITSAATDKEVAKSFQEYFSKGKVVGDPVITGDNAEVKILFGPDGTKEETFNMVRKNGKWYLNSF